ncbi:HAD-IB family phosphatase [Rhodococcus sp. IEGM 1241]|uniref:HAD family hydrolase n=1 Tax=Rhodococcus sp. IEGM 1241 TaxID=3082228 RepID=UPI002954DF28|nr:HAD-IB family phosphatase [Rhodococcus sp. IEGM 1241]MDV8015942.1 HAD-IB family phosphatase [Rhodococcus sp. IEGM 1241]
MNVLHVFDMDGTILPGTSASIELARHTGALPAIDELEQLSAAGQLSNTEFHRRSHPLWQNLTDDIIDEVFHNSPWIDNLQPVWADIIARGETLVVISMSPLFFVQRLTAWGPSAVFASHNPIGSPFEDSGVLEDYHKVHIVDDLTRTHNIEPHHVIAYGDSYTDIPLFRTNITSIAINATPLVESLATHRYRGNDLTAAYTLARTHLQHQQ